MKDEIRRLGEYLPWLFLLFFVDAFAALVLWLADVEAFSSMILVLLLFPALLFFGICFVLIRREKKKERAFLAFLENPGEQQEKELFRLVPAAQKLALRRLGELLRENRRTGERILEQKEDYEEYVESWAHEIKTPLSLLSFLLDNRKDELPESVNRKLRYIKSRMQESVDQMLFYARLKGVKKDYLFERLEIASCIEEALDEYGPLLEEKGFHVFCSLSDETVCTDKRGLRFLLGQIVGNAIKYCGKEPKLWFGFQKEKESLTLTIKDNGIGVKSCDLPYIFEKGFTGDSGENRKRATGMGLYLARGIADDLKLVLAADSVWQEGFEMRIIFPAVNQKESTLQSSHQIF